MAVGRAVEAGRHLPSHLRWAAACPPCLPLAALEVAVIQAGPGHIWGRAPCPPQSLLKSLPAQYVPTNPIRVAGGGNLVDLRVRAPRGRRSHACEPGRPPGRRMWLVPTAPLSLGGLWVQPCALPPEDRSCPPRRPLAPLFLARVASPSLFLSSLWGLLAAHSQVEMVKPGPDSHPSGSPYPALHPCKWGPHVRGCGWRRARLPRMWWEASLGAVAVEGSSA